MHRRAPRLALGLAVASLGACAKVEDSRDAAAGAMSVDAGPETSSVDCGQPPHRTLPAAKPVDILILLDRSESMNRVFETGTRYQAFSKVLVDAVNTYSGHVRFGYQEMPGRLACDLKGASGCCVSPPVVPIAANNAGPVTQAILAAGPMEGNTPTGAALALAYDYFKNQGRGVADRYLLLATDGEPNCTEGGSLSKEDFFESTGKRERGACFEAIQGIENLRGLGIKIMLLGLSPWYELGEVDAGVGVADCLQDMARAAADADASPKESPYYGIGFPDGLDLAIEHAFGGMERPSCVFDSLRADEASRIVEVRLDGVSIPKVEKGSGWQVKLSPLHEPDENGDYGSGEENAGAVEITGGYCRRWSHFQHTQIEFVFDCSANQSNPPIR